MKLFLANSDLAHHVTDEGQQLQLGMEAAGWTLAGYRYGNNSVDVPTLLAVHKPDMVLLSAREDWDASSGGCFDKRCSFQKVEALQRYTGYKVQVVKDCPGAHDRRQAWCEQIAANALLIYYHPDSVLALSPWMSSYRLIRTSHSIDRDAAAGAPGWMLLQRRRCIVSGAANPVVYPLRTMAIKNSNLLDTAVLRHPGYGNRGSHSANYLNELSKYKVHIATASRYGFSLRKIYESVAVGCVPVTNLPVYDTLPYIDEYLYRIPSDISLSDLRGVIDHVEKSWDRERALYFANLCWANYDWRVVGKRTDELIREAANDR